MTIIADTFTTAERDGARYMALDAEPVSAEAIALAITIAGDLWTGDAGRKRQRPGAPFIAATGAVLADLLLNCSRDWNGWGHRSLHAASFTGERIGFRNFGAVAKGMASKGLVVQHRGHQQWSDPASFGLPRSDRFKTWGKAARFAATPSLLALAATAGVAPEDWERHFQAVAYGVPKPVVNPLELRGPKHRVGRNVYRGDTIPVDLSDPRAKALNDQLLRLNLYLSQQSIEGGIHRGFRRIFNEGSREGYAWNAGGRFTSIGEGSYQSLKPAERAKIRLNGEAVAELDITASHLTILHGLKGFPLDGSRDPYEVEGLPRKVVKAWVTMTLGHNAFHSRWSPTAAKALTDLSEAAEGLPKAFPVRMVRERVLESLPVLADWPKGPYTCHNLQFIESEVIADTMERLAFDHSTPCLPVHDSIIVPEGAVELASEVLCDAFERRVGLRPSLSRKVG